MLFRSVNHFTIPNFPNYYLQADGGTICDSLPTSINEFYFSEIDRHLFPNPANKDIYLTISDTKIQSVSLFNSVGQIVLLDFDILKNEYFHMDVSKLESGFYFLELITEKEKIVKKFIRE